jgi:hypothetical protein
MSQETRSLEMGVIQEMENIHVDMTTKMEVEEDAGGDTEKEEAGGDIEKEDARGDTEEIQRKM